VERQRVAARKEAEAQHAKRQEETQRSFENFLNIAALSLIAAVSF
jgi:hypothetical protein